MEFKEFLASKCKPSDDPNERKEYKVPFTEEEPLVFGDRPENVKKILVLDTETTGFDAKTCEVIELAGVGMKVCADTGRLYAVGALFDWFNQPSSPIPPKITEITGITDEMVAGHKIEYDAFYLQISKCDIILAHNAEFDRPFVEALPLEWDELERPWACSCVDPDWPSLKGAYGKSYKNRKLEDLVKETGFFYDAHRAIYDCLATAFMLAYHPEAMMAVLNNASADTCYKVTFSKNPYGSNEILKDRGFAFRGKGHVKYYTDLDKLTEERKEIVELMKSYPGNTPNVAIAHLNPYTRFAAGL